MKKSAFLLIGLAALSAAGCGGGALSGGSASPVSVLPPNTGPAQVAPFGWGKDILKGAVLKGPIDESAPLGMHVVVKQRNAAGLIAYAHDVSDPHSPNYRQFLTAQEIGNRFGATESDYRATAAYFQQYGIHVSGWPQRESLFITGPISSLEKAFGTKFGIYESGTQDFIAPTGNPQLSQPVPIAQVLGMVHVQMAHSYVMRAPNSQLRGYTPQQLQNAFDFTGAYKGGFTGSGIDVAIVGTGPISDQDVPYLGSVFQTPVGTVTQVDVTDQGVSAGLVQTSPSPNPFPSSVSYPYSSGFQTPPPVTAPCDTTRTPLPACNPEDFEAQLDTETVVSLAPGSNVLFYLGYNPNDCYLQNGVPQGNNPCTAGIGVPAEGIALADAEIAQIIADDSADVVSMSYGLGEPLGVAGLIFSTGYYTVSGFGFGPMEIAAMVSEGMAVFASSGDNGAFTCGFFGALYIPGNPPCVSYPSGDPNAVSVGGVTAPLNDDGTFRTQITAWGDQTTGGGGGMYANNIGSGGGISTVFSAPSWQAAAGVNTLTAGYRGQPDIAMMADPNTAPAIVANAPFGPQIGAIGGTSLAAPQMAAMWALVLQACRADSICSSRGTGPHPYRLGNPAPLLYSIYSNKTQYPAAFYDVTYGDNSVSAGPIAGPGQGYQAAKGYDLVTGVGVPFAGHLIHMVLTNAGSGNAPVLP